jgi:nitrite reductase/ring-hydroxylating ferredoxin subunit
LHAARFEINGGKCLNAMGQRDLRCFPVKVEADRVWVQVPQA